VFWMRFAEATSRQRLAVLALAAVVVGSAMPWYSVSFFGTTIHRTGIDGDGWFSLIAGVVGIVCGLGAMDAIRIGGQRRLLVAMELAAGAIAALVTLFDFSDALSYGIVIVLVGGLLAAVMSGLDLRDRLARGDASGGPLVQPVTSALPDFAASGASDVGAEPSDPRTT
jgi:hypothetical protein